MTDERIEKDNYQNVLITFILEPDGFQHKMSVYSNNTIDEIKRNLAEELRLNYHGLIIPDFEKICTLENKESKTLRLFETNFIDLNTKNITIHAKVNMNKEMESIDYIMPNVIQVEVQIDEEDFPRHFSVEIIKFNGTKEYLGGFRNKNTNQLYHHASIQTYISKNNIPKGPLKNHRETQTFELLTRSIQTKREHGTQMERKDLILNNSKNYIIHAKPYIDSDEIAYIKYNKTLLIQCIWRGYKDRNKVKKIRQEKLIRESKEDNENIINTNLSLEKHEKEIQRRMNPRTLNDFEILYNELENWRRYEIDKIHSDKILNEINNKELKKKALTDILDKETKLLQTIDKLKLNAGKKNKEEKIKNMLIFMSRPKKWQMKDGTIKDVHTPFSIRAKELKDLYNGLKMPNFLSIDERLDVLLHVKWTVKEFDCHLTKEIVELIDREADMLNRGRSAKSLEGLRKRLNNLFLQFIETPEFNPEAIHLRKIIINSFVS